MNKSKKEIIQQIAVDQGITRVLAARIVNSVFEQVIQTVYDGGDVAFFGFGKFKPVKMAARKGTSPLTGKPFESPGKRVMKFYPAKAVKTFLNE